MQQRQIVLRDSSLTDRSLAALLPLRRATEPRDAEHRARSGVLLATFYIFMAICVHSSSAIFNHHSSDSAHFMRETHVNGSRDSPTGQKVRVTILHSALSYERIKKSAAGPRC